MELSPAGSPLRPRILIVDDEQTSIRILCRVLEEEYELFSATSASEALSLLAAAPKPDLLLLDVMMPGMNGYELCAALKQNAGTRDIPVIFITAKSDAESETQALAAGAVDFINKPINREVVLARVRLHLEMERRARALDLANAELAEWNANLKNRVLQQTALIRQKLEEAHQQEAHRHRGSETIVAVLANLLDQRHHWLGRHSRTVAALANSMASTLNLSQTQRGELANAALLHDMGLLFNSDRVLSRHEGLLSPDEVSGYRAHPIKGQELVSPSEELRGIGHIIRHHHEEFDGSGFPDGLAGDRIPLASRIIHLADYIDHAFARELRPDARYQVTRKLASGMNSRFDPALSGAAASAVMEVLTDPPALKDLSEQEVRLARLSDGMILSQDLYSVKGKLLMEGGTRLDDTLIEAIRRYYGNDDSSTKVTVFRKSINLNR